MPTPSSSAAAAASPSPFRLPTPASADPAVGPCDRPYHGPVPLPPGRGDAMDRGRTVAASDDADTLKRVLEAVSRRVGGGRSADCSERRAQGADADDSADGGRGDAAARDAWALCLPLALRGELPPGVLGTLRWHAADPRSRAAGFAQVLLLLQPGTDRAGLEAIALRASDTTVAWLVAHHPAADVAFLERWVDRVADRCAKDARYERHHLTPILGALVSCATAHASPFLRGAIAAAVERGWLWGPSVTHHLRHTPAPELAPTLAWAAALQPTAVAAYLTEAPDTTLARLTPAALAPLLHAPDEPLRLAALRALRCAAADVASADASA